MSSDTEDAKAGHEKEKCPAGGAPGSMEKRTSGTDQVFPLGTRHRPQFGWDWAVRPDPSS